MRISARTLAPLISRVFSIGAVAVAMQLSPRAASRRRLRSGCRRRRNRANPDLTPGNR